MASDNEPENFFRSTPQPPPLLESIFQPQLTPLGKHTETLKITNQIAFIMISKSAKSLQTR